MLRIFFSFSIKITGKFQTIAYCVSLWWRERTSNAQLIHCSLFEWVLLIFVYSREFREKNFISIGSIIHQYNSNKLLCIIQMKLFSLNCVIEVNVMPMWWSNRFDKHISNIIEKKRNVDRLNEMEDHHHHHHNTFIIWFLFRALSIVSLFYFCLL